MSVHIEHPERVTALLVAGSWLGVEPGTLQRQERGRGSSGTSDTVYRWDHAGYRYLAAANEINAIQMSLPA